MNLSSDVPRIKVNKLLFTPEKTKPKNNSKYSRTIISNVNKRDSKKKEATNSRPESRSPLSKLYLSRSPSSPKQNQENRSCNNPNSIPSMSLSTFKHHLAASKFPHSSPSNLQLSITNLRNHRSRRKKLPSVDPLKFSSNPNSSADIPFPSSKPLNESLSSKIALNLQRAIDKYHRRKGHRSSTNLMGDKEKRREELRNVYKSTSSLTLALSMKN